MNQQDTENKNNRNDEQGFNLRDLLIMAVANWRWFILSIVIFLGAGAFVIYKSPKIYVRSAAILVKDSNRGNVASALFADLSGTRMPPNVENEIFLLNSQRMMSRVVEDLDLNINYVLHGRIRTQDLYGSSPVDVVFLEPDEKSKIEFRISFNDDNMISLTGFSAEGIGVENSGEAVQGALNDTLATPAGRLIVIPTDLYATANRNDIYVSRTAVENAAVELRKALTVRLPNNMSSVITLSFSDVNTLRAEALLNKLMETYQGDVIEDKRQVTEMSRHFLDERLKVIEGELGEADARVLQFKENYNLVDVQNQTLLALNENTRQLNEIFEAETQLSLIGYLRNFVSAQDGVTLIPANVGITDPYLNSLIAAYNEDALHRQELLRNSNERNPAIVSLTSSLNAQFAAITTSMDNLLTQLSLTLKQLKTRERLAQSNISAVPGKENQMLSITRQQAVKEQLYLYLLNKKEENDLNAVIIDSDARVVEYPYGQNKPVSPKIVQIMLLALLLGAVVPLIVLFLSMVLNTTVRSRRDIEELVSIPVFGEIPMSKNAGEQTPLVVKAQGRDSVSEAFRILRSNFSFMNVGGEAKVILITSTNVSSGKTFFSINMAATLAMANKRVLLIDGDLRKRSLSRRMGVASVRNGLSLYLTDRNTDVKSIISVNVNDSNVDMLFAGPEPPNPAEILMSSRLEELFVLLREQYDYILIDSVPATLVADAIVMGRVADRTIYVIREGLMNRSHLSDVEKLYQSGKLPNMSIVLNGVRESTMRYGYSYGYGYGNQQTKHGGYYHEEDEDKGVGAKIKKWFKNKGK